MSRGLTPQQERLSEIVRRFTQRRIAVVGDALADQFLYGEISRVSREAPVMILRHERTETLPGGAANCAANLASLGAHALLIGVVGEDPEGLALLDRLRTAGVDCSNIITSRAWRTTTKVRILAGQIHSTRQQVIRVDYEGGPLADPRLREQLLMLMRKEAVAANAVIISDYNYGVADAEIAGTAREAKQKRGIPVIIDSRFKLAHFPDFTSATPNENEVEQLLGRQLGGEATLRDAGVELRKQLGHQALLITQGSHGMMLFEAGKEPLHIEAVGAREPVDVTGAGDTVIATYALALASGASFPDAARLANHAGGLVVMKRGTASINGGELLSSVIRWGEL